MCDPKLQILAKNAYKRTNVADVWQVIESRKNCSSPPQKKQLNNKKTDKR